MYIFIFLSLALSLFLCTCHILGAIINDVIVENKFAHNGEDNPDVKNYMLFCSQLILKLIHFIT